MWDVLGVFTPPPVIAGEPDGGLTKVAMISNMFNEMSNYWLFASGDKIVLLGGMLSAQGGGNWENKEVRTE